MPYPKLTLYNADWTMLIDSRIEANLTKFHGSLQLMLEQVWDIGHMQHINILILCMFHSLGKHILHTRYVTSFCALYNYADIWSTKIGIQSNICGWHFTNFLCICEALTLYSPNLLTLTCVVINYDHVNTDTPFLLFRCVQPSNGYITLRYCSWVSLSLVDGQ